MADDDKKSTDLTNPEAARAYAFAQAERLIADLQLRNADHPMARRALFLTTFGFFAGILDALLEAETNPHSTSLALVMRELGKRSTSATMAEVTVQ